MGHILRAFASGAAGVLIAEQAQPYVDKYLKPDSEFMRKASKVAVGGASTAAAYYLLGAMGVGGAAAK